jgi:hypothetical protein
MECCDVLDTTNLSVDEMMRSDRYLTKEPHLAVTIARAIEANKKRPEAQEVFDYLSKHIMSLVNYEKELHGVENTTSHRY